MNDIYSIIGIFYEVKYSVLYYDRQLYQIFNLMVMKLDSIVVVVNEKIFVIKKIYQKVFIIVLVLLFFRFFVFLCFSLLV